MCVQRMTRARAWRSSTFTSREIDADEGRGRACGVFFLKYRELLLKRDCSLGLILTVLKLESGHLFPRSVMCEGSILCAAGKAVVPQESVSRRVYRGRTSVCVFHNTVK